MHDNELKFRTLNANELECRVGATSKDQSGRVKSFQLLLYKTARVDANILDETVGPFNWQKRYYQVKNTMICSIGINLNYEDSSKEPLWIWKDDGGDDDFQTEQVKGECSDSMKRAAFQWGIGRELYYGPKIWVNVDEDNNEKSYYSVKTIDYDDNKRITKLIILNTKNNKVAYLYPKDTKVSQTSEKPPKIEEKPVNEDELNRTSGSLTKKQYAIISFYYGGLKDDEKVTFKIWLEKKCLTKDIKELSEYQAYKVIKTYELER